MANYYYAYSGHKFGLDRVRRGVALIKAMKRKNHEMQLLVNDFRAGLAAKELGVGDAVTIETLLDVDAVAQRGDLVVLDTPEDVGMRMEQYCDLFGEVFYVTDDCTYRAYAGETVLKPNCTEGEKCVETPMVDAEYFDGLPKEDRILFFFGDADYNKEVLAKRALFEGTGIELLLGHYFFVKYESELEKTFALLHEPEEYTNLVRSSSRVLTVSIQCALEAKAAEAEVFYVKKKDDPACIVALLSAYNINIFDDMNNIDLKILMQNSRETAEKVPNKIDMIADSLIL